MRRLLTVLALAALATPCAAADPASGRPHAESQQDTLKERLSDKASDDQRVDDCNVPVEKRGAKKRPGCAKPAKEQTRQ
jgi:hypothetical protein